MHYSRSFLREPKFRGYFYSPKASNIFWKKEIPRILVDSPQISCCVLINLAPYYVFYYILST